MAFNLKMNPWRNILKETVPVGNWAQTRAEHIVILSS